MKDKDFYIATKDKRGEFVIYVSEKFRLSEIELINLIKINLVEARSKMIGKKLLRAYKDATQGRKELTNKRLKLIGIEYESEEPVKKKKPITK